jgi:glycosyltransferase involved in cell wall biosynthesis
MSWHLITGEYPPAVGGVSDYTFTMAAALGTAGPVHVWCPAVHGAAADSSNVTVHRILNTFSRSELRALGRELDSHPAPRELFVQWTPQSFGYRSLNVGFAAWLASRATRHHDVVHLMVHEPFLSSSSKPSRMVAAATHRLMLWLAARHAAHVWVSTSTWQPLIRPFVPARTPVDWLPVPAPVLPGHAEVPAPTRRAGLIGHFGTHSPLVTPLLEQALDVILEKSNANVLLVGRDSDMFLARFVEKRPAVRARVNATGVLPIDDIAPTLHKCDLMIQPYPDGVTTRRTSTLTLLSLGIPVVTNLGHLSEDFWATTGAVALAPAPDGTAIGDLAVSVLSDDGQRLALAGDGAELYDARFSPRHSIALLTGENGPDRHAA